VPCAASVPARFAYRRTAGSASGSQQSRDDRGEIRKGKARPLHVGSLGHHSGSRDSGRGFANDEEGVTADRAALTLVSVVNLIRINRGNDRVAAVEESNCIADADRLAQCVKSNLFHTCPTRNRKVELMNLQAFEAEMTRLTIFWMAIQLAGFIIGCWVLYVIIKTAIRDGINESRLGDRWSQVVQAARKDETLKPHLPDMRADR
jgi:hypothetical protein